MSNIEKAVKVFCEAHREYLKMYEDIETMNDLIELWGWDSKELKDEILYELYHNKETVDIDITDDCEIIEKDGTIHSYRSLVKAIRSYKF